MEEVAEVAPRASIKEAAVKSDQAARIVAKFGGRAKLARLLSEVSGKDVKRSTIQSWEVNDGFIPAKYHHIVVDAAKAGGIRLTPEDFLAFPPGHPLSVAGKRRGA